MCVHNILKYLHLSLLITYSFLFNRALLSLVPAVCMSVEFVMIMADYHSKFVIIFETMGLRQTLFQTEVRQKPLLISHHPPSIPPSETTVTGMFVSSSLQALINVYSELVENSSSG